MSSRMDVLKEGYSRWLSTGSMAANGSSVLIRSNQMNIVFDTLNPWDRQYLIDKLKALGLHCSDIDLLVCSHTHTDHIGNLNLFTDCQHIVGDHVYREDVYRLDAFREKNTIDICADVQVVATPGHTVDSISLIVKNADKLGTIGISGDLFECESDLTDDNIWISAGSQDVAQQRTSRAMVLDLCDYIVPGHGLGFRTNRTAHQ